MNILKISFVAIFFIIFINNGFSQSKPPTRKEHLESLNKHYYILNNHLWSYVSHVANQENMPKIDKKRRAVAKLFYEEKKKIAPIGGYKNSTLIFDALNIYANDCETILKNDFKEVMFLEEANLDTPLKQEHFLKELKKAFVKLNTVTQTYINTVKSYNSKYFSKQEYSIHKNARHEDMQNKIEGILKTHAHYTPIYIDFLKSKSMEEKLYTAFEKGTESEIDVLAKELLSFTNDSKYRLKNTILYKKDTMLVYGFTKVLNSYIQEAQSIIPQMLIFNQKQIDFENSKAEFISRDQSKLTPEDYDEMDILVEELNESNTKYNTMYNEFLDNRNQLIIRFNQSLHHFLAKHIVREH